MKSFIFALCLLIMITAITMISASVTDEYADRLLALTQEAVDSAPDDRDYAVRQIASVWEDAKFSACVTIHRKESTRTDTLVDALSELCERPHTDVEYYGVCKLLEGELRHIKELSRPSWRKVL